MIYNITINFQFFIVRRDTRTFKNKISNRKISRKQKSKMMKQLTKFSRNDDEIFDDKRRRNNIKKFRQTIDETIDRIINFFSLLRNFFFHLFFIMI